MKTSRTRFILRQRNKQHNAEGCPHQPDVYHGRHIAGTIPSEESDALLRGGLFTAMFWKRINSLMSMPFGTGS